MAKEEAVIAPVSVLVCDQEISVGKRVVTLQVLGAFRMAVQVGLGEDSIKCLCAVCVLMSGCIGFMRLIQFIFMCIRWQADSTETGAYLWALHHAWTHLKANVLGAASIASSAWGRGSASAG